MFYTLYIVNKAGGLIFNRDLSPVAKLATNDLLTNASTFHSLHAISRQVAPVASGGISVIDCPTFSLYCFESLTGVKFFVTARPRAESPASAFLARVYEAYADYVCKSPFYETDMPIRIKFFDLALDKALKDTQA